MDRPATWVTDTHFHVTQGESSVVSAFRRGRQYPLPAAAACPADPPAGTAATPCVPAALDSTPHLGSGPSPLSAPASADTGLSSARTRPAELTAVTARGRR